MMEYVMEAEISGPATTEPQTIRLVTTRKGSSERMARSLAVGRFSETFGTRDPEEITVGDVRVVEERRL